MSGEDKRTDVAENGTTEIWHVFGKSVTGASHILKKMPNQDAIHWRQGAGFPFILAIADGHGSSKYFRSGIGARYATEIAVAEMERFAQAFSGRISNDPLFHYLVEQLPLRIVEAWRRKIEEDLNATHFFTKEEWQRFGNGRELPEMPSDPLLSYGATLLAVLVAESFILYLQLGDGDIVVVDDSAQVSRPIKEDARLLANETTSLCSPTAVQDFRISYEYLNSLPPAMILLSTDGYVNSFTNEQGFLRVGPDILATLRTDGLEVVKESLGNWLTTATTKGSGDDITLGIFYHEARAQRDVAEIKEGPEVAVTVPPVQLEDDKTTGVAASSESDDSQKITEGDASVSEAPEKAEQPVPRVFTVSLQPQEGMYTSIRQALAEASAQTRIEICPGEYRECLVIDKDVELVGVGEDGAVIIVGPTPCLTVQATQARIEHLMIQGHQRALDRVLPRAVVEISTGNAVLDHCQITGGRIGIRVRGNTTNPTIQNCEIHTTDIGVVFAEGAQGLLLHSHVYGNKRLNIEITSGSNSIIRGSKIEASKKCGMRVSKGSQSKIEGCSITDNTSTGIEISQKAHPTLLDCTITNNQGRGILFTKRGGGELKGCEITKNRFSGLEIVGDCHPEIQHCKLQDGYGLGILIDGKGQLGGGIIEDCDIFEHKEAGILLQNRSHPIIRRCHIQNGEGSAILVKHKGGGRLENCKISTKGYHGIMVEERGHNLILHDIESNSTN